LGDWVNLMGHQKAACEMIKELYTPETICQSDMHRKMFSWYVRFDLFAGFMAGNDLVLGNEWFTSHCNYVKQLSISEPGNIDWRLEALYAEHRILGVEMAQLLAKLPRQEITVQDFIRENEILSEKITAWQTEVSTLRSYTEYFVLEFKDQRPLGPDDIVNPYEPGKLFTGPLFPANYMMVDYLAMEVMHKYQTAMALQQPPPAELTELSLAQCQILEALDLYPESPLGAILPTQASLGLICLFVPRDEKHISWCRKRLAKMESHG
jgi:hypothetical protein